MIGTLREFDVCSEPPERVGPGESFHIAHEADQASALGVRREVAKVTGLQAREANLETARALVVPRRIASNVFLTDDLAARQQLRDHMK
jgi:hypothetical protein